MDEVSVGVDGIGLAEVFGDQVHDQGHLCLVLVLDVADVVDLELAGHVEVGLVQEFVGHYMEVVRQVVEVFVFLRGVVGVAVAVAGLAAVGVPVRGWWWMEVVFGVVVAVTRKAGVRVTVAHYRDVQ